MWRAVAVLLIALTGIVQAEPLPPERVPDELRGWVDWVLWGEAQRACPASGGNVEVRQCAWPTRLTLAADSGAGRFRSEWFLYADGWAHLPGDGLHWPDQVAVDGQPASVVARDGEVPAVWLTAGGHTVTGRVLWKVLPEGLAIPPETGQLAVTLNGAEVPFPGFNERGELWLQGGDTREVGAETAGERLVVQVFRLVDDDLPLRVLTRLVFDVAGPQRDAVLRGAVLPRTIPLRLVSDLPARLEANGDLKIRLQPGRWNLTLETRSVGPVDALELAPFPEPWPGEEIWSFAAHPELRRVLPNAPNALDPSQTNLPEEWRNFPAFKLTHGDRLELATQVRGDPEPEPDRLSLERHLWLDFSGQGFTAQDRLSGQLRRQWRLQASPEVELGRVSLDGQAQPITLSVDGKQRGVELRRGQLDLEAVSRLPGSGSRLSASGWDVDMQAVRAQLHLPPGWRLLAATGVDNAPQTWLSRWSLLDLFLVALAALAVGRLWPRPWGFVALLALVLLWQEFDAPRYVWLNLLAAEALLRVLPNGRIRVGVATYRGLCMAGLVLIAVPFVVEQLRVGFYPQTAMSGAVGFEPRDDGMTVNGALEPPAAPESVSQESYSPQRAEEDAPKDTDANGGMRRRVAKAAGGLSSNLSNVSRYDSYYSQQIDPQAKVQTGPGLPQWNWSSVALSWNGPVERGQTIALVLLSPTVNLFLSMLRVALLLALAWRFCRGLGMVWPQWMPSTAAVLLTAIGLGHHSETYAEVPPQAVLDELKGRLLAPPACLPHCAEIERLVLRYTPEDLELRLTLHVAAAVAVPLPSSGAQWMPQRVLQDGNPAKSVRRIAQSGLEIALTPGVHELVLLGPLPSREQVQLPLPLKPRRLEFEGSGWTVAALRPDGGVDDQLRLIRNASAPSRNERESPSRLTLPDFLLVSRTLKLGLDWRAVTVVRREVALDQPASLELPLIAGESVISGDLQVREGHALVQLPPGRDAVSWESVLPITDAITLEAQANDRWVEHWALDTGPMWRVDFEGTPVISHRSGEGYWLPEWRPWPGEKLMVKVSRPAGAPGPTVTIDRVMLEATPGERATDLRLALNLRSSQGGLHRLQLPPNSQLLSARIDGAEQPLRLQDAHIDLPIKPGAQNIALDWRWAQGMRTNFGFPALHLGLESVNATFVLHLPEQRWTLGTLGPSLGPAVLFWPLLAVLALLAFGLARSRWTPLTFRQWLLLLLGLSQVPVAAMAVVVGWFLILAWRAKQPWQSRWSFNAGQVLIALTSMLALVLLYEAVSRGLLGLPEMQIAGNGSSAQELRWYQDRLGPDLSTPAVWSLPVWAYRVAMLLWAAWLAFSLLDWLRWAWRCFTTEGWWRPKVRIAGAREQT